MSTSSDRSCAIGTYICTKSFDSSGRRFTCLATPTISPTFGLSRRRVGDLERHLHADRIAAAERAGERLIDDADARTVPRIARVECAAGDNRQVERREIRSG